MNTQKAVKKLSLKMLLIVIGMFGFGFALVPIYDVFCDITGLNGKTENEAFVPADQIVDTSREITVQFITTNNDQMIWEFRPEVFTIKAHPGQEILTTFFARNPTNQSMVGQAIPNVSPGRAAVYFHKTECFCFEKQMLKGGETITMPVKFIVDRDVPDNVNTITLSYTLFDITDAEAKLNTLAMR
jgi:cytochrome c oxidase assembly protein subunit 11